MKTEYKKPWIEALRSNKYEQTIQQLRSPDDKFCCLGVLCDIIDTNAWELNGDSFFHKWGGDKSDALLTNPILEEVGLTYEESEELFHLNDSRGYTFNQIADYIETEL